MLRHVIENCSFGPLLAMAACYSIGATLCVLLLADGVAHNSALWPHIVSAGAALVD